MIRWKKALTQTRTDTAVSPDREQGLLLASTRACHLGVSPPRSVTDARSGIQTSAIPSAHGSGTMDRYSLTSGSESSTSVLSFSIASQIPVCNKVSYRRAQQASGSEDEPIRARTVFLKLARTFKLNSTVCFSMRRNVRKTQKV